MEMRNEKTKKERIELIIRFLKGCNEGVGTMANLMNYLKKNLKIGNVVSQRTIEKDFHFIRKSEDSDYFVDSRKDGKVSYYVLQKKERKPKIDESVKEDIGILLQLINTHEELESVLWLKDLLKSKHHIDESHFENDEFFVLPKPKNENHDNILRLALQIIKHAKKGEAILFDYLAGKKNKNQTSIKLCAPLQVRVYDNRYYMIALDFVEEKKQLKFKSKPFSYAIDAIQNLEVQPAPSEFGIHRKNSHPKTITFNHTELSRKIGLKKYFDHCIGVFRPETGSPKTIKLKFTDWARSHVKNNPIHPSQEIISKDGEDELIVSLYVYDTFELDYLTARYRNFCKRIN